VNELWFGKAERKLKEGPGGADWGGEELRESRDLYSVLGPKSNGSGERVGAEKIDQREMDERSP